MITTAITYFILLGELILVCLGRNYKGNIIETTSGDIFYSVKFENRDINQRSKKFHRNEIRIILVKWVGIILLLLGVLVILTFIENSRIKYMLLVLLGMVDIFGCVFVVLSLVNKNENIFLDILLEECDS